jgi:hypothetical protein
LSRRFLTISCFILLTSLWGLTTIAAGDLVSNLQVKDSTFSPDGDGLEDYTDIDYTLADDAVLFSAAILSADTQSVIDTLVGSTPRAAGSYTVSWDGRNLSGQVVPEGDYILVVHAEGDTESETHYRQVQIDLTVPQVTITSIQPSFILAPGLNKPPLQISFELSDAPPTDSLFTNLYITGPGGGGVDTLVWEYRLLSTYAVAWNGSTATEDGPYQIQLVASDNGAHSGADAADIYVDLDPPLIEVTSFESSIPFQVLPDSIRGWAYDANSLTPLEMRYRAE